MIPELWNELGDKKIGDLNDCLECFVEEERNGIFELTLEYPNDYPLADQLLKEKIIIVNANDTLLNQKFRIYDTKKFMNETITVFARHISFDLMYDYVNDVTFENQSCEYALNSLFRQSQFSTHYRGYSDIVNAQNYSMSMCNILEAIGGKEGSIIDTFGTGAEILRDNTDIHVLNARGHDNGVTIEYGKNLTGFELSEDTTNLVTRILPYAKYTPEGGKETLVRGSFVDSPLISSYSHPYIKHIDYTDKFKDKEIPTKEKLETFARNEYRDNKVDIPKTNFKIEFIPLSKCVGYEELEDKISICDKVTIKNTRYNVDTKSKVIKYKFDVIKERYESMELGEPRTTFGDIIGSGNGEGQVGPQGPPGADGSMGDFPNTLPSTPVLTAKVYGFATIELSWTFEDKVYYTYELYASKTKDFPPKVFDLIHAGQSSSFLFQAKPNETWYFKVCAKNTHGERTEFSEQVIAITKKIDDLSNYVDNMAIGEALIGELSLDRGWVGKLNANYLDVKGNLSVTNGNGKRTLDIDSFGDVHFMPRTFKILIDGKEEDVITNSRFEANNKEWTATFQAGYEQGIIRMNRNGFEVNHTNNGASKFSSECLAFYDRNGIPNIKVIDGGFNFYSANGVNEFIGVLKPTSTHNSYINGLTLALSNVGDFYDIGYYNKVNAYNTVFKIIPNSGTELGGEGVHFNSLPAYFNKPTTFNSVFNAKGKSVFEQEISLKSNDGTPHLVGVGYEKLPIYGRQGFKIGTRRGTELFDCIVISDPGNGFANVASVVNWDFNRGEIYNANIVASYSLAATSPGKSVGADTASIETMLLQEDFATYNDENNTVDVNINEAVKFVYAENMKLKNENEQLKQQKEDLRKELNMTKNVIDSMLMGEM